MIWVSEHNTSGQASVEDQAEFRTTDDFLKVQMAPKREMFPTSVVSILKVTPHQRQASRDVEWCSISLHPIFIIKPLF